jgi:dTDP-4-dehydrorhamnose 3,5-epimerase
MHAQSGEAAQAKLVRTITGKVLDVAVDMRRGSSTFGKYVAVELSEENKRQLFVPRGFYHGFLVLSPEAIFSYKVVNLYNPAAEVSLHYADPSVGIPWPLPKTDLLLSPKDEAAPAFSAAYTF